MKCAPIGPLVLPALLAVLAASAACRDTPTAPSAPVTWTISPASAVMRAGDTVVFRVTSSAPAGRFPLCRMGGNFSIGEFQVVDNLASGPRGFGSVPSTPTTGDCTVTLRRVFQPGRASITVVEEHGTLSRPQTQMDVEAPIDIEL